MEIADFLSSILMFFEICCSFSLIYLTMRNIILNNFDLICFVKLVISCIGIWGISYLIKKFVKHNRKISIVKEFIRVWTPKSILGAISMLFLLFKVILLYLING